jgi:hypothetical protein
MRTPAAALALFALMLVTVAPSAAAPARAPWFSAADARCAFATVESKRLLATIPLLRTRADGMAFLRKGFNIQARLLDRLQDAGPPARDAGVQRFMSLYARSIELDRKSLAELERGVDPSKVQRSIDEGGRLEDSARRVARQIGLRQCARYLDPKTFR